MMRVHPPDENLQALGVEAGPKDENSLLTWQALIRGPEPFYGGGNYKLDIVFTNELSRAFRPEGYMA